MSSATPIAIAAHRACVTFDGDCVVDEVDLTINKGEFVAVVGGNGAGKTTLLRALLGLAPLSHGSVDLFGKDLRSFRDWQRVAYVPQRLTGSSSVPVSVIEVVRCARLRPHRMRMLRKIDRERVQSALENVGLWHRRNDRLDTLSGGQQRRVIIARALASDADLFILDEPTSGVDAESQQRLAEALGTLKDSGATIVVVTHELGALADLVTRVVLLEHPDHNEYPSGHEKTHGSLIYDGPPPGPIAHIGDRFHHHEDLGISHTHGPLKDPMSEAGGAT